MLCNLKGKPVWVGMVVLGTCFCESNIATAVQTDGGLSLKPSQELTKVRPGGKHYSVPQRPRQYLLGKVGLLNGVPVNTQVQAQASPEKIAQSEPREASQKGPLVKAVYGGLHIALPENLGLVYSPGRLTRQTFDSESHGLYLVTDHRGQANWFVGVESSSYVTSAEARRTANSAQFGVILSLD